MYQYRDVTLEDFAKIAMFPSNPDELYYMFPQGIYPLSADQLREAAASRFCQTVITRDDEVIGYSNLYDVTNGETCYIGNVIINPHSRGTGAGSFLIQAMIQRAVEQYRVTRIHLICHNTNSAALLLYYKMGFKPEGLNPLIDHNGNKIAGIKMGIHIGE